MNDPLIALTGFAGWTLVIALIMISFRFINSFGGKKIPLNAFSPDGDDLPGFGRRVTRAHLNCVETLPVFAAIVAAAGLSGQMGALEGTAIYVLYARLGQSAVHMMSGSLPASLLRGGLFTAQVVLMLFYVTQLLP